MPGWVVDVAAGPGREVERVGWGGVLELLAVVRSSGSGWRRRRDVSECGDSGGGRSGGGGREEEAPHVDGEQAAAVAASHRHRLQQAAARHAHLHTHNQIDLNYRARYK